MEKYILQAKVQGEPNWFDMLITEDIAEVERDFKEKVKTIPLNSLRIVKTVITHVEISIKTLEETQS
jgi:hypothetical protein